jgi:hypothetical protein
VAFNSISDIHKLAAALGLLAIATSKLKLDGLAKISTLGEVSMEGLKPVEETIKAVVALEKLDGTPQVDRLVQQIVQLNEVRATPPKTAPKGAEKAAPQIVFPDKLKLVIGTRNGSSREFEAYVDTRVDKRAAAAVRRKMAD